MSNRWNYQVVEVKPGLLGGFKGDAIQAAGPDTGNQKSSVANNTPAAPSKPKTAAPAATSSARRVSGGRQQPRAISNAAAAQATAELNAPAAIARCSRYPATTCASSSGALNTPIAVRYPGAAGPAITTRSRKRSGCERAWCSVIAGNDVRAWNRDQRRSL